VVAIGGLVEIAPLFYLKSTIEKVKGMRPYTPLELAGRAIYVREGCYNCHSQMVRPLRDEVERYGHYSLAAESMYDHPFQWGSKRTGPDLARVGGKYSDEWQRRPSDQSALGRAGVDHAGLSLPGQTELDADGRSHLKTNRIGRRALHRRADRQRGADLKARPNPDEPTARAFQKRYPKAQTARDFDGNPARPMTEMDALVAYLQMLGTLVDFNSTTPKPTCAEEGHHERPTVHSRVRASPRPWGSSTSSACSSRSCLRLLAAQQGSASTTPPISPEGGLIHGRPSS
jgi:cytochrome c oxidase cbb3-type subunit 2